MTNPHVFDAHVLAEIAESLLREAVLSTLRASPGPLTIADITRIVHKHKYYSRSWHYNLIRHTVLGLVADGHVETTTPYSRHYEISSG